MWVKADLAVVATFAPGVAGVAFWQPGPATSDIVAVSGEVANPGAGTPERVRCVVGTNIWFTAANDVLGVTRSTGTILDGRRHHVLFYVPDSSNRFMYLDGTYRVQTFQAVAASGPATLQIGGAAVSYGLRSFPGVVDEVALYRSSLGDYIAGGVRAAAHYAAGVTPWAGDNAGTRIGRVLNLAKVGWPAALRAIDTGQTVLGTATLGGRLALDYLQAVERTEQGRLFIDGAGKIVFHSRDRDLTATRATTSQATFTDDGTGIDYLTSPFAFTRDERQVFNEVSASRDGGQTVTVTDATSTAAYGVLSHSISGLLCSTDIEVREVANRVLWTHKTPQTRVETFTVRPEKAPANWPAVLALEIGDRVTVKRFPQSVGTQISKDFLVQQIAHTFDPGDWTVSITASPVDTTSYFAWGTTGQWGGPALWR